MPEQELMVIENEAQLEEYMNRILDDISFATENRVRLEDLHIPPITIHINDGTPEHSGTITTKQMGTFVDFQKRIYELLDVYKGTPLTEEEKADLVFRIKVEKGSTSLVLDFYKILEAISNMSLEQTVCIANAATTIALAWIVGKFVAVPGINAVWQSYKEKLEAQKAKVVEDTRQKLSDNDLQARLADSESRKQELANDRVMIESMKETSIKAIGQVKDMLEISGSAERKIYRDLSKQPGDISINDVPVPQEELKTLGVTPRTRIEGRTKVIRDNFRISVVDFGDSSGNVKINMIGAQYIFKDVTIPDDLMDDRNLDLLAHAKAREAVPLELTVIEKNGKFSNPTLITRIDPSLLGIAPSIQSDGGSV